MPTTTIDHLRDPERLAAVQCTALLDPSADAAFDRLTRLVSRILGVPVALVVLVDVDREVFKGCVGLPEPWASRREAPLSHSFCQHIVTSTEPLVVEDARVHPLVRDNLAIPDLGVVAYAGIPLATDDGHVVGTLCAIDHEPRTWTEADLATLRDLAASAMTEVELRVAAREAEEALAAHRRAEAAHRKSEERYRTLFASIDEGFCVVEVIFDPDGHPVDYRFLEANPAFERHTGLVGAVGRTARELVPDLEAHWFDTYGRVAATGEAVRFVDEAKPMGGRSFDVYAFRLGAPELRQVAIVFTDVTERRRDEEARARLAAIVESSWDAIVGRNLDGTITSWSPGAEALYGYAAEEIVGQSIARLLPPGQEEELVDLTTRLRRGERIPPFETVRLHKDGTPIEVEMSISPILGDAGTPLGVAAIARDIRARRTAERLQQEFLESVSHDLKNPLTAIRGQVQLLHRRARRATPDRNVVIGTLVGIEIATQRMETQLGELQDAARLRSGHPLELHTEPVDLAALAEEAVAEARQATSRHDVRLEVPDGALVGRWDALRLRRVIDNLLSNALKYSEGGEVVVTIRDEQREGGLWAVFAVRDEGVGIPAADLPHVFERYRRGSNVGKRTPGTGIGLSGADQIVHQHGGTISVESEEGRGSTFTVALPMLPMAPPISPDGEGC